MGHLLFYFLFFLYFIDYIVKPFSIKELLVRVAALLRRVKKEESSMKLNKIVSDPFELDLERENYSKMEKK